MAYFKRFLDYSTPKFSVLPPAPRGYWTSNPFAPHFSNVTLRRSSRHQRCKRKMASFTGPWSKDIDGFKKTIESMPEKYKKSFADASKATLEKICDPDILHIWESDSDIDSLLQLTSVIAKLCNLGSRKEKGANELDGCMIIIAEEKDGRNNFMRICQLVAHLTCASGKKHLEGTVCAYGKIVVVKGWDNSLLPTGTCNKEASEKVVKRINVAIERAFKMGNFNGAKKKIVWHHGPVFAFLLHWINNTTSKLRYALYAITITASLQLTDRVAPSKRGRANTLPDLTRLEEYAKKLDIAVVFLDTSSQLITSEYLATYVYYYSFYINMFLPPSLSSPHLGKAQDELITFAFRLRAASEGKYGSQVVKMVQNHLPASKAKDWAKLCIDKASYEKPKCRAAAKDAEIYHALQLADSPFALLSHGNQIPAFARLAVGPAAAGSKELYIAAPTKIDFRRARLRPSNPSTFFVVLPAAKHQDVDQVTSGIQGLMICVLNRMGPEKGIPQLGHMERATWKAVVNACTWALEGCAGKMPKGVEEKVGYVKKSLEHGRWVLFYGKDEKKAGAAVGLNSQFQGGHYMPGYAQGGPMAAGGTGGVVYPPHHGHAHMQMPSGQANGDPVLWRMPLSYPYQQGSAGMTFAPQQQAPAGGGGFAPSSNTPW